MNAPNIDLTDQVAIITGGGSGIGAGIAVEVARRGADVVILDIDAERAEAAAGQVTDLGRTGVAVTTDCLDTDQIRAAVARAEEQFGRIDILVNNVGGVGPRRFENQSERSWRRHIELNLVSMLAATSASLPMMIAGGRGGSILNITSIEGTRAAPLMAVYSACKAGMISFTRTMAVELGEHGIRVNAIAPDITRTEGISALSQGMGAEGEAAQEWQESIAAYIPLGREGVVSECANVAAFLCSSLASYVTGAIIPVDGGTWASSGWNRTTSGGWGLFGRHNPS